MNKLVLLSIMLALVVIVLGAYARLTAAGLGCPDWPECYGHLSFSQTTENIDIAQQAFPERPFEEHKAWTEMIHRYFASALGFLILVIFINSLFSKTYNKPVKLPLLLVLLVCFQGALGMWTVTLNLLPAEVMGHLLGGFTVLSGLFLLYLRLTPYRIPGGDARMPAPQVGIPLRGTGGPVPVGTVVGLPYGGAMEEGDLPLKPSKPILKPPTPANNSTTFNFSISC